MSTRVFVWRRSQRSQPSSQRRAFTLLEVMIATMILAVGMSAALDAIWHNNNFRRNLDETAMAELVLRQMASRLKTTSIFELGHPYEVKNASGTVTSVQGWTMHLRATDWTLRPPTAGATPSVASTNIVLAAVPGATGHPYSSKSGGDYAASTTSPYPALTQQNLIDAGILRELLPIQDLSLYVEYYNLSTQIGFKTLTIVKDGEIVPVGIVPVEIGLIKRFNNLQQVASNDSTSTVTPREIWRNLVGDPGGVTALSPQDFDANGFIMPAIFSLNDVNNAGVPQQVRDAFAHGLVIRILASWRPNEITDSSSTARAWSETLVVRRD
jgi:prepilin-type N-terminal cleavage/methylation domain-containing protein